MVAVEAAVCGAPVVVTDTVGCGKELEQIGCASIVKYGDIDGLTRGIDEILDRRRWPNRPMHHLDSLREWLSWPRIAREYETAYMRASQTQGTSPDPPAYHASIDVRTSPRSARVQGRAE